MKVPEKCGRNGRHHIVAVYETITVRLRSPSTHTCIEFMLKRLIPDFWRTKSTHHQFIQCHWHVGTHVFGNKGGKYTAQTVASNQQFSSAVCSSKQCSDLMHESNSNFLVRRGKTGMDLSSTVGGVWPKHALAVIEGVRQCLRTTKHQHQGFGGMGCCGNILWCQFHQHS